jgi:hypothetical protein
VRRAAAAASALLLLVAACGDDDDVAETGAAPTTTTTAAASTTTPLVDATTTTAASSGLEQPALWPAADVVFATPEEAAEDFVREALGVEPTLGDFQQGDARSGEIAVLSPGEGGGSAIARGTLLLRQLGPDDGWFVIGVTSDVQTFASPAAGDEVPAGTLSVDASGRGFEGTVVVSARIAGRTGEPLDSVVAQGGSFADPAPFTVELDLGGAAPGDTVVLVLQGGVGLEDDPGDVAAIPVTIG